MGEVYRALDTKLGREVAIKILLPAFASDPERLARFEREAQVLAALNHPHIAAIHGFEDSGGVQALVLELVDGPTLADRIARGPLPLDEALAIARQIANALEAAHGQGIIHRDLKPSNIKVRADGTVKVLDFGLAKLADPTGVGLETGANATVFPTITSPTVMTRVGTIIGTAAYMSPEQAKGKPADKRCDIWAFGCVLFEMLTGTRAFEGDDVAETLAAVLRAEPNWATLPADTPPSVRRLLRRALEKDRQSRLPDIAMARLEIDEAGNEGAAHETRNAKQSFRVGRIVWASAIVLAAAAAGVAGWFWKSTGRGGSDTPIRVELNMPVTGHPEGFALSPDGRSIVAVGGNEGRSMLWLRPLNANRASPLAGTENADFPFWSPDSRSIGFFADSKLKRLDLDTGAVRTLATAPRGFGGTWNKEGTILFVFGGGDIMKIPATGGSAGMAISVDMLKATAGYRMPQFLPDGHHFLLFAGGTVENAESNGIYVGDLSGAAPRRLLPADGSAVYASGHLLFVRGGTLFAQSFDADRVTLTGSPVAVADEIITSTTPSGRSALSASEAIGAVAYRSDPRVPRRQFTWVNRSGVPVSYVGEIDTANALNPAMSRDGRRIAYSRRIENNTDIWTLETSGSEPSRFTTAAATDQYPVWSPDGSTVVFSSIRDGGFHLYQKNAIGSNSESLLLASPQPGAKVATDWSADGRFLLFRHVSLSSYETGSDIWALPMTEPKNPFPVVQTPADEGDGQFSPDGKWIAYQSDESGRNEIYVQAFPKAGRRFGPISRGGGTQVRWRTDGKELFYISPDSHLMAVSIRLDAAGDNVEAATPTSLFLARVPLQAPVRQQYIVSPDGQRFLLNAVLDDPGGSPIELLLNPDWLRR
jgi:Tol biopolymer transport system component